MRGQLRPSSEWDKEIRPHVCKSTQKTFVIRPSAQYGRSSACSDNHREREIVLERHKAAVNPPNHEFKLTKQKTFK